MRKFLFLFVIGIFISCSSKPTFTGRYYGFLNLEDTYGYGEIEFKEDYMEVYVYEDFFTGELLLKSCPRKEKLLKDGSIKTKIFNENWTFKKDNNNLVFENESGRYFILSPEKKTKYEMNNFPEKIKSFVTLPDNPQEFIEDYKNKLKSWNIINEVIHDYSKEPFKGSNFYYKTVYYDNGVEIIFSEYNEITNIIFKEKISDEPLTNIIGLNFENFIKMNYVYKGFSKSDSYSLYLPSYYTFVSKIKDNSFSSVEVHAPI